MYYCIVHLHICGKTIFSLENKGRNKITHNTLYQFDNTSVCSFIYYTYIDSCKHTCMSM